MKDEVCELVERFDAHKETYHSEGYNEAQLREEFLNPFFAALGWDVYNRKGYAGAYKEVIHEDAIKVGGRTKAPDYCFRAGGGVRSFFVEAKKPSIDVGEAAGPAYQLRRYAWSAKLPVSILTDFEHLAVYDCRIRPQKTDKAATARIIYRHFTEYVAHWDELVGLFSPEAIRRGSLERLVASKKIKKGTAGVDAAFLDDIETWRSELARNIALRNEGLSQRDLNVAVQATIDRIVFLRICEDRGIEPYGTLESLQNATNIYRRLGELFQRADDRYNSGLFHFAPEKDRPEPPDELTLKVQIDDKPLKDIICGLYFPDSPYEFSVLPAEILGQVYEQFLGKVIYLTKGGHAKVLEKPEVRKAGGVYYTPAYIVDYIVEHTVGRLLDGGRGTADEGRGKADEGAAVHCRPTKAKTPAQAAKLRILDPACGSGSFLIGAYQYLLNWHRDWYVSHGPEKHARGRHPKVYRGAADDWRLTSAEKRRILLNNIYGVDIDPQAVEVTKLSLLLKVLEGESKETVNNELRLFHERALPDLAGNIKCGNSLVGPDFYNGQQLSLLDDEERYRINVFDWHDKQHGFGAIMAAGGFDAVIGNPPYLNIDDTWGKGDPRQRYISQAYADIYRDKTDILFYFLGKAVDLTRGLVTFIVSRAFLEAYKADGLRGWLATHAIVEEIIDLRNFYVFPGVGITTALISLEKTNGRAKARTYRLRVDDFEPTNLDVQKRDSALFERVLVDHRAFKADAWVFAEKSVEGLHAKVDAVGEPLGRILVVGQGMQTGRNSVFGGLSESHIRAWRLKPGQYYARARNSDIGRYVIRDKGERLLYLENVEHFDNLPKSVQRHLTLHQSDLKARAAYKRGDCQWWQYTWPLHKECLGRSRLYCPYLAAHNRFALDAGKLFLGLTDTTVLYDAGQPEDLRYILGLLNSRLLTFRFRFMAKLKSGGILEYFWNTLSKMPIRRINFSDSKDKSRHDRMVKLVETMLGLQTKLASARTAQDKTAIQRQIAATDRQIDQLVYELYGLTDEEIEIVERGTGKEG